MTEKHTPGDRRSASEAPQTGNARSKPPLEEIIVRDTTSSGGRPSRGRLRTDGGSAELPFDITSSVAETSSDRARYYINAYFVTPWSILREDWRAKIGFTILMFYIFVGTVGAYLVDDTHPAEGPGLLPPFQNWDFPLGTTSSGRDIMSMVVNTTPDMLIMMTSGALFTIIVGTLVGVIAGYKGGMVDTVLSTITDIFINLPGLPLVMVLATLLADFLTNFVVVGVFLAVAAWAGLARAIRSQVLTIRNEDHIESARALDLSQRWILLKEILPHLMPYITVNAMNAARSIIFAAVALYFLGILPYRDANWGVMLSNAQSAGALYRPIAYHWILIPTIVIVGLALALILLAQSMDRVFNPRIRARHLSGGVEGEIEPTAREERVTRLDT